MKRQMETPRDVIREIRLSIPDCPVFFSFACPTPEVLAAWPNFPKAATPEGGRVANGRGLSPEACSLSCLGEAVELASCCAWGDEPTIVAGMEELGPQVLSPIDLCGFSRAQLDARAAWNAAPDVFDWRPEAVPRDRRIAWMAVREACSGAEAFAPADFVLIGRREAGDPDAVAVADSNGCACGESVEAAKLAALLELIERDATGRWWYGRRHRLPVALEEIDGCEPLRDFFADRLRSSALLDITSDLGIPVYAAVSADPDGSNVALGFAADVDASRAALSALTEMLQMELSLEIARQTGAAAGRWGVWCRNVDLGTAPLAAARNPAVGRLAESLAPSGDAAAALAVCLDACKARDVNVFFADRTRPEFGIPVVRALSTGLCHDKPRFGRPRLLAPDSRDQVRAADVPNPKLLLI